MTVLVAHTLQQCPLLWVLVNKCPGDEAEAQEGSVLSPGPDCQS